MKTRMIAVAIILAVISLWAQGGTGIAAEVVEAPYRVGQWLPSDQRFFTSAESNNQAPHFYPKSDQGLL